jgi:tetratricopeptide (TPR) repeat protein
MANALEEQGRLKDSIEYHTKALTIYVTKLGAKNGSVGNTYTRMAGVLQKQGNLMEAMQMYKKVITIVEDAFGPEHSEVGNTYYRMASLATIQNELEQAVKFYTLAANIYRKTYGTVLVFSTDICAKDAIGSHDCWVWSPATCDVISAMAEFMVRMLH